MKRLSILSPSEYLVVLGSFAAGMFQRIYTDFICVSTGSVGGGSLRGMRASFGHTYQDIISIENLLEAWTEFINGKRSRKDVRTFELNLMDNILDLHIALRTKSYRHGGYISFNISDPKPRIIHKATVRDRLLHHAIYRQLYPFFDRTFITDSYSCRNEKGIHKGLDKFRSYFLKVSRNNTKTAWVLKCDIRKFFASMRHDKLMAILSAHIDDPDVLCLLNEIISSFSVSPGVGLPLGNLTSQLLANVYMNEFDQFVKHRIKVKYYIRYADDFVFLDGDREYLVSLIPRLNTFLENELELVMHPDKLFVKTFASGVDFLGWVHFPDHRILRTVTKKRMQVRLRNNLSKERLSSYLGLTSHGNTYKIQGTMPSLSNEDSRV
jgi:RNA-directed DNA polymerase